MSNLHGISDTTTTTNINNLSNSQHMPIIARQSTCNTYNLHTTWNHTLPTLPQIKIYGIRRILRNILAYTTIQIDGNIFGIWVPAISSYYWLYTPYHGNLHSQIGWKWRTLQGRIPNCCLRQPRSTWLVKRCLICTRHVPNGNTSPPCYYYPTYMPSKI